MVVRPADCSVQNVARRGGADDKPRGPAAAALTSRDSGRARSAGGPQCVRRLNNARKEKRVNSSRNAGTQHSWVLPRHSPALVRAQRAPSNRRISRFARLSPTKAPVEDSTRHTSTCCTARTPHNALVETLSAVETSSRIPPPASTLPRVHHRALAPTMAGPETSCMFADMIWSAAPSQAFRRRRTSS